MCPTPLLCTIMKTNKLNLRIFLKYQTNNEPKTGQNWVLYGICVLRSQKTNRWRGVSIQASSTQLQEALEDMGTTITAPVLTENSRAPRRCLGTSK